MKDMLLKIAAVSTVAILSACDSDSTVARERSPVEDSALALQVLSARGDTLLAPPDSERIVVDASPTRPIPPEPLIIPNSRVTIASASTPAARVAARQVSAPVKQPPKESPVPRVVETRVASTTPAPVTAKPRSVEPSDAEPARRETRTRGTVSAGSSLAFAAGQRVCTASEGDTFEAVLLESVRGTNGVVIPRGARGVAQITSLGEWGAGMGVRVKSVRFKGRTYPLLSDVGYVALERGKSKGGACIPERGRIDAALKQPLTVLASN